jgi:DNA mismatch repair protein MSH6
MRFQSQRKVLTQTSSFDQTNQSVNDIKAELNSYLEEIKGMFKEKRSIGFCHAKFRYEIEIPAELVKGNKKPADFEFTS